MQALEIVRKSAEMWQTKIHLGWQIYVLLQQSPICPYVSFYPILSTWL